MPKLILANNILFSVGSAFALAVPSRALKLVTTGGMVAGAMVGAPVAYGFGLGGLVGLLFYFSVASLFTKIAGRRKPIKGDQQKHGRNTGQVLANGALPVLAAVAVIANDSGDGAVLNVAVIFFCGSVAAAFADTAESELGPIFSSRAYMPLGLKKVEAGANGAISAAGTVIGIAASFAIAGLFFLLGLIDAKTVLSVGVAGVAATLLESVASNLGEMFGFDPNNLLNLINSAAGGSLAFLFWSSL